MSDVFDASDAKNRFGRLLDAAQSGPVRIRKNGRDVAVVLSAEAFCRLVEDEAGKGVSPAVKSLYEKSAERWAGVYRALADR